ncbi:MAG: hypothetical protein M3Q05_13415 [Bacteroidota bacterium]|nr:hypothetical protein [Bacteroidota bacterium]
MKKQLVMMCLTGLTLLSMVSCGDMYSQIFKVQNVTAYAATKNINGNSVLDPFICEDSLRTESVKPSHSVEIGLDTIPAALTKPSVNPILVEEDLMVSFAAPAQQVVRIRLLDQKGKVLVQHRLKALGGQENFKFSLNNQKNGRYVLEVLLKKEHQKIQIVKQAPFIKRLMIIGNGMVVA